jgi:hypothetical protein
MAKISSFPGMRCLACALSLFLAVPQAGWASEPQTAPAAQPAMAKLNIVVVKGEGAINNIKQRTAREVVVQVEDENRRPVAGAAVAFLLPNSGPSATFADGSKLFTMVTDQNGRAAVTSMRPNQVVGSYQVNVNASFQGLRTAATVNMKNVLPLAIAGMSAGVFTAVVLAATAGVVLGVRAATSSSTNPTDNTRARVTIGAPTLP